MHTSPPMSAMDSWIQKAFVASVFLECMVVPVVKAQQFTVQPESMVQAEGLEAVFECQYPGADGYAWFINDSGANLLTSPPGIDVIEGPGDGVSVIILATSEYNSSVVLCEVQVGFGSLAMFFRSKNATLEVHGVEVTQRQSSTNVIILFWTDPFTTNLTFCVEINQTVLGSTETVPLDPVCGLTGTQYTFSHHDHIVCDRFSFTVTPTEGGRRGTSSQAVTGFFTQARGEGGSTTVSRGEDEAVKQVTFNGMIPNCTTYSSFQVDSDLLTDPINGSNQDLQPITFSLPTDKVTEVTVTLTDINGIDLVFESIPTSTFDVRDLIIYKHSGGGGINVSVVFAGGSQSPGALVCVMPILTDGSLDFNNMTLTTIPRDRSESVDITVPTGTYRLLAFDLESNGLPRMPISVAADNETVNVTAGGEAIPPIMDMGVTAFKILNKSIEVTCPDVSLNCLVLLLSTTDNPDQVHVGLINSEDDRTVVLSPGATDVSVVVYTWKRDGSIFSGKLSFRAQLKSLTTNAPLDTTTTELLSFDPGVIAGIAVTAGVLLLLVAVTGVVILLLVIFGRKHANKQDARVDWSETFPGIEQPNEAYSVVLNKNIAYEQTQRAQRQRDSGSHNPTPSEGNGGEYEDIEPVHQYEEVLPQDRAHRTNYVNIDTDNV